MQDCIFCKIIKGQLPSHKVYEDEFVLAFLDIKPVNEGHTLVIPKNHHKDLLDTPSETQSKLIQAAAKIAPAILKAVGANSFNLGLNNGKESGQIVFHTHFHIMPRFDDDGHKLWVGKDTDQDDLTEIAQKIKSNI